jgi:hypothetical protein
MFNEYYVYQLMKFRQEETEKAAKDAWKFFSNPPEESNGNTLPITNAGNTCCQCVCA